MKVAVVGFGYWGEKLLLTLQQLGICDYLCVIDSNPQVRVKAGTFFVDCFETLDAAEDKVDALIVATWESTHFEVAQMGLVKGKHVLVEKPLALRVDEARKLVEIAQQKELTLMVDHTFMYDKTFNLIKTKLEKGEIGNLVGISSFRFSPGIIKPFSNVIEDLFPHDISIFTALLDKMPLEVEACGYSLRNKSWDNAMINLKYGKVQTQSLLSWTHPVNRREMIFYGSEGILLWQKESGDIDSLWHFIYNKEHKPEAKDKVLIEGKKETLSNVLKEFYDSICLKKEPLTSGRRVLREIGLLEKALEKVKL